MQSKLKAVVAVLIGVPIGIGAFAVHYAGGTSYLSGNPAACTNCHIMDNHFDSWQKASHHSVATCVDCHLPASGIDKWVAKAVNGYKHCKAFTLQNFDEPIMIGERNSEILQANCVRCHGDLLHDTMVGSDSHTAMRCVHCHRSIGHGEWVGLGGPDRGESGEKENR